MKDSYINISKAFSSSLVERIGTSTILNSFVPIKQIAEAKGLKSTRSLRLEINKIESKYISREVKVNGGTSYEILFSSLEPDLQQKLREAENKTTALVPQNYKESDFVSDKTKLTANYRANIVVALQKLRKKYPTKKEADTIFLDLYNSGLYLPKAYNFIGSISIGTLHRWVRAFEKHETTECLQPKYKWSKQGEYNSILNDEMRNILLTLLLHPSKYNYGKAIKLTKEILRKRGYEEFPCDLSFKRFAENFRKNNYAEWVLRREGMKAYHDKVEPYIERDISKIDVGDILVADGHVLNFQVNDILQLMEIQPEVLELALMYLINEGAIQEKDGVYTVILQKTKKGEFENKNLKLMFMFHSPKTVDLIMRGFCALIPAQKLSHLVGVDDNCIGDFYRIFRNLIYERQLNELLNYYFTNPQQGRFRKFFEKYAYFYSYNNKIYVSKKLLQANREKNFTDAEIQDFKKVYSYLSRIESYNMNEVCLHQRLAEGIWRRAQEFQELYDDLKNNLIA